GAASVAHKDVPAGETVWGSPSRPIQAVKRSLAALGRLPDLMRKLTAGFTRLEQAEQRLDQLEGRKPTG
ncbi:MAG: hypothetical protein Q8Q85_05765, partial [Gemmatimonadales bacterium]|nr:hypothetical protein [Gemmatimonadales bacterium]